MDRVDVVPSLLCHIAFFLSPNLPALSLFGSRWGQYFYFAMVSTTALHSRMQLNKWAERMWIGIQKNYCIFRHLANSRHIAYSNTQKIYIV